MMKRSLKTGIQLGLYGLILAGTACDRNNPDDSSGQVNKSEESTTTVPAGNSQPVRSELTITEQVTAAISDLATRQGVDKDTIVTQRVGQVTWGTSALGCPQPDMNYTQALVPGLWAALAIGEQVYYYHGRLGAELFFCPADRVEAPIKASKDDVM